ncbi:hypothetical protein ACLBX9_12895 [Methylobacterium sp. A49B]
MSGPVYHDMKANTASDTSANQLLRRLEENTYTADKLSSPMLLSIALAGSVVAALLIRLVLG